MFFGGQNFAYVSKKHVDTYKKMKAQNKNVNEEKDKVEKVEKLSSKADDLLDIIEEVKEVEVEKKRGRKLEDNNLERKKSRSRSRSVESVCDVDLDAEYSDEDQDEEGNEMCNLQQVPNIQQMNYSKPSSSISENEKKEKVGFFGKVKNLFTGSSNNNNNNNKNQPKSFNINNIPQKKVKYNLHDKKKQVEKHHHEIDTNVLTFKFNFLKEKVAFATGDPYYCKKCKAILNKYSNLEKKTINNSEVYVWKCEFCEDVSELPHLEKEEIPVEDCVDYFVQNVSQIKKDLNFSDEKSIIYCFDTSGSMCVSEPLSGKHNVKGEYLSKYKQDLMKFSDGSSQFYDGNSGGVTYVSRLQCLQAGIESYLSEMSKAAPKNKVGIVTFANEVICVGDGSKKDPIKIEGNKLTEYDSIVKAAEEAESLVTKPISDTAELLKKHLYTIEETGQTALGPAILFSVNLIKNSPIGSKIILCTDGLANIGLGSMEEIQSKYSKDYQEKFDKLSEFYDAIGEFAKSKGIIINLLTFEGEESRIEILSQLCLKTGGEVIRVKQTEILNEFSNLMINEIVASNVSISVKLHKALEFRNEDNQFLSEDKSDYNKQIGNATNETELYVEYRVKSVTDLLKLNLDIENLKDLFFQSIITYTNMEGNKCIRVITKKQELSNDKEKVNQQAKYDLLSVNAIQQCSKLAQKGEYRNAQSHAVAYKQMVKKQVDTNVEAKQNYNLFNKNMNVMNNNLQEVQYKEEMMPNNCDLFMDVEKSEEEFNTKTRKANRNDALSYNIWSNNNVNVKKFNKKK